MKIGIVGYTGRVGQLLVRELQSGAWKELEIAGGSSRTRDIKATGDFPVYFDLIDLCSYSDCVIDFTTPEGTMAVLKAAQISGKAVVIGTTGLSPAQEKEIHEAAKRCPIVYAANTSIGLNILLELVKQAAAKLGPHWDIEIFESHHKNKVDSPSGTALALGKSAREGRGKGDFVTDRNGRRKEGDIGYAVSRGGDVVGEHMVTFYGLGERLELGHKASDRSLFAKGALQAAQWLNGKPAGLYGMRDVLGL